MEKYKLIDSVSKTETLCNKVTIDGFDYYVSDGDRVVGDYYIGKGFNGNNIFEWTSSQENQYPNQKGKVIATNNPNIDIPKVVDEVKKLCPCVGLDFRVEWINGYNKSQQTHPFSEEDFESLIEFIESFSFRRFENGKWRRLTNNPEDFPKDFKSLTTKEFIQLWKEQKPKIVYYE